MPPGYNYNYKNYPLQIIYVIISWTMVTKIAATSKQLGPEEGRQHNFCNGVSDHLERRRQNDPCARAVVAQICTKIHSHLVLRRCVGKFPHKIPGASRRTSGRFRADVRALPGASGDFRALPGTSKDSVPSQFYL